MVSQTTLDTAVNFHVKTIDGVPIWLFDILDNDNKIVVIDFFSTSCGPCQQYAPDFQGSYEDFDENNSNVYFMGINWGSDNDEVRAFDSTYGLTYPTVSGVQGGGNGVFNDYNILSYPTVIVIVPEDHVIVNQEIVPPVRDSINKAVIAAGGIMVGIEEYGEDINIIRVFPNPVQTKATISFTLDAISIVSISIVDIMGREKQSISPQQYASGNVTIPVDLSNLIDGVYFIKIKCDNMVITRQIIKSGV